MAPRLPPSEALHGPRRPRGLRTAPASLFLLLLVSCPALAALEETAGRTDLAPGARTARPPASAADAAAPGASRGEAPPLAASSANASSSHAAAMSTAVTSSIGAEVVDELGCSDTEFRLTCRELDSTIAILDARFFPFDGSVATEVAAPTPPYDPALSSSAPNDTASALPEDQSPAPCPAPKEWLEAGQWARAVSPDGAAVVDPIAENESFPWPLQPNTGEYHFRLALNHRCSGVNHCSFILSNDFEEAGLLWGPGAVRIRYACMRHGRHLVRYCNEDIVAGAAPSTRAGGGRRPTKEEEEESAWEEGEGFVASPGYPKYYVAGGGAKAEGGRRKGGGSCEWVIRPRQPGQRVQLTLLDVSLRGVGPYEQECSDRLEITAVAAAGGEETPGVPEDVAGGGGERVLLSGCGEAPEAVKIESPEEAPALRIALRSNSGTLFPKRGLLFHYKALGCRWPPPSPPKDGYLVARNVSVAQYMCCVGFQFPDTGRRERELLCDEQRGLWRVHEPNEHVLHALLLPDCIVSDGDTSLLKGNSTNKIFAHLNENTTSSEKVRMKKDPDFMMDVIIPTIIIGVLLFGNGIILYIIFQFKKRKLSSEIQEEELRIAQIGNGPETTTAKPSDV